MTKASFFLLLAVFLVFLWIFLPATRDYPYYQDDVGNFERVSRIASKPLAAWEPDYRYERRFPFHFYFLFMERMLFGFGAPPYFFVLLLLHFANSLFVLRLSRVLGGGGVTPLLAALLFLVSASFYQQLIFIHATQRVLCVFLVFVALFSWIEFLRRRRFLFLLGALLFQVLALLTMEDAVVFPFLTALLTLKLTPAGEERRRILWRSFGLFFLVDVAILLPLLQPFFHSPHVKEKFVGLSPLPQNLLSLAEMLFRPLLVPDRGLLPATPFPEDLVRLVPSLFLLLLLGLFFSRAGRFRFFMERISWPLVFTSLVWIGISVSPFLFQPLGFEHANRYLYLPMAGFSLLFGVIAAGLIETLLATRSRKGFIFCCLLLAYLVTLNLRSTVYHYQRYVQYANQHEKQDYYDRVKSLK